MKAFPALNGRTTTQLAPRRTGLTLIEVGAAATLLAMLLASSVPMFQAFSSHQRAADRHDLALETVQNLMEELTNKPWDDLTPGEVTGLRVPDAAAAHLPAARLTAAVVEEQDSIEARRITVALTWNNPSGQPAGPVRLTAWSFPELATQ